MQRIQLSDIHLAVHDRGSGPPLLLVHGFPLDHSMWEKQIVEFADDFRVLAPDLRGFGASQAGEMSFTMQQFADDLAEMLDGLDVPGAVDFCGLSMGGYVAWQFWERHPERLKRLVLCDTRAAADTPEARQQRLETAERVEAIGGDSLALVMVDKLFSPHTRSRQPELLARTKHVMQGTSPQSIAAALRGMAERPDMTAKLPAMDLPCLLMCGEEDQLTPPAEMRQVAEQLPDARFVGIADAAHMAPLEQAAAVNRAMRDFLRNA